MKPDVVVGFANGEPDAVRAVYKEYGKLVYAVAYRALGDRSLAEEATQETFVRAWRGAASYDPSRELGPGWPPLPEGAPSTSTVEPGAGPPSRSEMTTPASSSSHRRSSEPTRYGRCAERWLSSLPKTPSWCASNTWKGSPRAKWRNALACRSVP